jgi:hypothetical protein
MALPAPEEGKLLSEALNTVKIQVQQMKRHLVSISLNRCIPALMILCLKGTGSADGCSQECKFNACRTENFVSVAQTIL